MSRKPNLSEFKVFFRSSFPLFFMCGSVVHKLSLSPWCFHQYRTIIAVLSSDSLVLAHRNPIYFAIHSSHLIGVLPFILAWDSLALNEVSAIFRNTGIPEFDLGTIPNNLNRASLAIKYSTCREHTSNARGNGTKATWNKLLTLLKAVIQLMLQVIASRSQKVVWDIVFKSWKLEKIWGHRGEKVRLRMRKNNEWLPR